MILKELELAARGSDRLWRVLRRAEQAPPLQLR
jgi:hypothetical protein